MYKAPLFVTISELGKNPAIKEPASGEERYTSNINIIRTVNISTPTIASIFLNPSLIIKSKSKTSNTVIVTPKVNGMLNSKFKAIALPITSAISVAIIANSAKIQANTPKDLLVICSVTCAKSIPLAIPNLAHMLCNSIADKLDIKITNNNI